MTSRPSDRLQSIIDALELSRDAIKTTRRVVTAQDFNYLRRTVFVGRNEQAVFDELEEMRNRIDEIALLNLWIVFERFVIDYLCTLTRAPSIVGAAQFSTRLVDKVEESIERWRFDEVLDLFKGWIDSDQVGRAKQICSYRNWIAHRNAKGPRPTITDPKTAMLVLGGIMDSVLPQNSSE